MDRDKKLSLNIVSKKIEHRGFGAGMIDLSNLSSIIVDQNEAYVDVGAIHAKSKVEKGIKFTTVKEDVPNGRICWVVWVAVDWNAEGKAYYAGVTNCEMLVDTEARRGWKILAEHVMLMEKALKRQVILTGLNEVEKAALKQALVDNNPEMWAQSGVELKEALA